MQRLLRGTHTQKSTKPHPKEYTPPNYDTPFPEHLVVFLSFPLYDPKRRGKSKTKPQQSLAGLEAGIKWTLKTM